MNTTTPNSEKAAPVVLPVDLRDYFAAKALQCVHAEYLAAREGGGLSLNDYKDMAADAYTLADAMLTMKARQA